MILMPYLSYMTAEVRLQKYLILIDIIFDFGYHLMMQLLIYCSCAILVVFLPCSFVGLSCPITLGIM